MIMDIQPLYEEFSMSKYMNAAHRDENLLITIQTLRAKVASAEVFNLEQILHDPENQPSQYGTVPLEWYENLENKINRIRFNVEQVIDSLSGSYDMHAIRKKLQTAVDEQALATYDKLSEKDKG